MIVEQQEASCVRCERVFVSDRTPMAKDGHCMFCRPHVQVACSRCREQCPGAYDGQKRCGSCRSVRLGTQQYEDKEAVALAYREMGERGYGNRPTDEEQG